MSDTDCGRTVCSRLNPHLSGRGVLKYNCVVCLHSAGFTKIVYVHEAEPGPTQKENKYLQGGHMGMHGFRVHFRPPVPAATIPAAR